MRLAQPLPHVSRSSSAIHAGGGVGMGGGHVAPSSSVLLSALGPSAALGQVGGIVPGTLRTIAGASSNIYVVAGGKVIPPPSK